MNVSLKKIKYKFIIKNIKEKIRPNFLLDKVFEIMETSIDYVYDSETVYDEFTKEELKSFLESMDKDQLEKIMNFFNTMPSLEHEIEYTCTNCGEVQKYILRGISDFFM